jgi:hypothetical protein
LAQPEPRTRIAHASAQAAELYSAPRSVWKMVASIRPRPRVATAASSASVTRRASWALAIDQPTR